MLKKTITYENFDGEVESGDFYFNLSQAELVKLEVSSEEGFAEALQDLVKSNNRQMIIDAFERIILMAYGEKSEDGRSFLKEDIDGRPLSQMFKQTAAYSQLFVELTTDTGAAASFVNGVIPASLAAQVAANQLTLPTDEETIKPPEPGERILELPSHEPDMDNIGGEYVETPAEIAAQYDLAPEAEVFIQKTQEELETMSQPELLQYLREQQEQ